MITPRLRRRIVLIAGSLLVLLVLHLIWAAVAERRLAMEMALARAAAVQEQATPGEDEAHNAVPVLLAALAAFNSNVDSPAQSNMEYADHPPFPKKWHELADAAVAANARSLALLREARHQPTLRWQAAGPNIRLTQFSTVRELSLLAGDAALHAHVRGDDVEALERCQDLLFLARAIDQQRTLVAHLVAHGMHSAALNRIKVIAPGLSLTRDEASPLRATVRRLIQGLLAEPGQLQGMRGALHAARNEQMQAFEKGMRGTWVIRPMSQLDAARSLRANRLMLAAATMAAQTSARAATAGIPDAAPTGRLAAQPPRFTRELSDKIIPSMHRWLEMDLRDQMERRLTAVALAAQLHRVDHDAWPAALSDLVPAYLPSVPRDVYSDGDALGYVVLEQDDGKPRPLLFDVGRDGKLDRPDYTQVPSVPQYGWYYLRGQDDQFRDLSRWLSPYRKEYVEPAPATTQP